MQRTILRAWAAALLVFALTPVVQPAHAQSVSFNLRDVRSGDSVQVGKGNSPALIAVFATWCRSCKDEVATFNSLASELAPKGVRIVALSADEISDERLRAWLATYKASYPVVRDTSNATLRALGVVGVPEVYLVDTGGHVVWSRRGPIHGRLSELRTAIQAVLTKSGQ